MTDNLIIHIHGFLSSSEAERVSHMINYVVENELPTQVISPVLADNPEAAVAQLKTILEAEGQRRRKIGLLGHSLGGYYAAYLSHAFGIPAVLVNPVVRAYEIMCEFYGECYNPHKDSRFEIREEDIAYLFRVGNIDDETNSRLLVLQQLGDEIVDAQDVLKYYEAANCIAVPGGCHAFEGFDAYAAEAYRFMFGDHSPIK